MPDTRPPRLTYVVTGLQYGGATIGMVRLLSELEPDEFDVTVVALADTPPDVLPLLPDHVTVYHLKINNKLSFFKLRPLVEVLRETDILVCSLFHATAVGVTLGKLLQVPNILVWQHNTAYSNRFRSLYYRITYRIADRILADSKAVQSMLVNSLGISEEKISTVPIAGVDIEKYSPGQQNTTDTIKIGTIGRLVDQKGYPELLDCAEQLGSKYQFHVIGDGPRYEHLSERAPENVRFWGRVDDEALINHLREWDIYFQPSRYEGLCMTVIEAMSCGLPVVASSVGGIVESVVSTKTGFLCNARDVDCYSKHLRYLGDNPTIRSKMGKKGRERVKEKYSSKALANSFRTVVAETTSYNIKKQN